MWWRQSSTLRNSILIKLIRFNQRQVLTSNTAVHARWVKQTQSSSERTLCTLIRDTAIIGVLYPNTEKQCPFQHAYFQWHIYRWPRRKRFKTKNTNDKWDKYKLVSRFHVVVVAVARACVERDWMVKTKRTWFPCSMITIQGSFKTSPLDSMIGGWVWLGGWVDGWQANKHANTWLTSTKGEGVIPELENIVRFHSFLLVLYGTN